jgi:hypothetical protein
MQGASSGCQAIGKGPIQSCVTALSDAKHWQALRSQRPLQKLQLTDDDCGSERSLLERHSLVASRTIFDLVILGALFLQRRAGRARASELQTVAV